MRKNYQILCDEELSAIESRGEKPSLLLQSCCGPCSSYVLEYLSRYFDISILYYNPNIYPYEEYIKRLETQREIVEKMPVQGKISILPCEYDHEEFLSSVKGLEGEPEGGGRCTECFRLRLLKTALLAKENGFDYFTTTLSVSPHKNADVLNSIGFELSKEFGISFLVADFKKRNGYKRSIELSKEFDLYRQIYCGCEFSMS